MSILSQCKTIGELVDLQSQRYGNKPFIISPDEPRAITYQQLGECINRVAGSLRQQGVSKGDKVSILLPNIPEYAYIFLGVMKLGAVANPINIHLKAPELQFVLGHA